MMSNDVYDMTDFMISKEIIKDTPNILRMLDNYYNQLIKYQQYRDVANVLDALIEAQMSLAMHYDFYEKIYKNKGKVDE